MKKVHEQTAFTDAKPQPTQLNDDKKQSFYCVLEGLDGCYEEHVIFENTIKYLHCLDQSWHNFVSDMQRRHYTRYSNVMLMDSPGAMKAEEFKERQAAAAAAAAQDPLKAESGASVKLEPWAATVAEPSAQPTRAKTSLAAKQQ